MPNQSQRPSIMDSHAARRAMLGVGAVLAAAGAAYYFARRKAAAMGDALVGDGPSGIRDDKPRGKMGESAETFEE